LQKHGRDAFYRGEIAAAIVAKVQANGGVMTKNDLAEFQSEWVEPISTTYHGYDVFELPPPGQGFAALHMLNILEVCVPKLGASLDKAGSIRSDVLAPDGRSQETGVLGSVRVQRRPEVFQGADRQTPVEIVCGDALRSDRCERRIETARWRRSRRRHDLSDGGRSLGQHGLADSQRLQRVWQPGDGRASSDSSCTIAGPHFLWIHEVRTWWRPGSGRSIRSSPVSS
jgi:hypothetical protein